MPFSGFHGSNESNIVVLNVIKESQQTRYVRFLPITWDDHVCIRVEVYGCEAYTGKNTEAVTDNNGNFLKFYPTR